MNEVWDYIQKLDLEKQVGVAPFFRTLVSDAKWTACLSTRAIGHQ